MTCITCGEPATGRRCRECIRDAEREGDTVGQLGASNAGGGARPSGRDPGEREWLRRPCGHLSVEAPCEGCLEERRRMLDDPGTIRVPQPTAKRATVGLVGRGSGDIVAWRTLMGWFPPEWAIEPAGSSAFATASELRADGGTATASADLPDPDLDKAIVSGCKGRVKHVPDDGGPLCGKESARPATYEDRSLKTWLPKPVEAVPNRPWCKDCLRQLDAKQGGERSC